MVAMSKYVDTAHHICVLKGKCIGNPPLLQGSLKYKCYVAMVKGGKFVLLVKNTKVFAFRCPLNWDESGNINS